MQKTALIVDDEIEICHLLLSYLRKKKYKAFSALTLEEGISLAETHKLDIIFLDNNLPDGTGIASISKFKSLNEGSKVIIISARTNLAENAIAHGAAGFLSKPISYQNIDSYLK